MWISAHFRVEGGILNFGWRDAFWPVIGSFLGIGVVFEPIIFSDLVAKRIKRISGGWLFLRGLLCGSSVFWVWVVLYDLGMKNPGYEIYLIIGGWLFANTAAVWAVWHREPAEQISDGNAGKPLGVERTP